METVILVSVSKRYDAGYTDRILGAFQTEELADEFIQNQKRVDCIHNPKAYCIIEYHKQSIPFKGN